MYKGKILQKTIAMILVLCMTATNFLFVATSTVYAISEKDEDNIIFEAYFKKEDKKLSEKTANISEGEKLYFGIEIKAGKLQNAKIEMSNANFEIIKEEVKSKYIGNIEGNEISLKDISYNDGKIELELPVKFQKAEKIKTAYFNMETNSVLSGKYKNSDKEKDIKSNTEKTKLNWVEGLEGTESKVEIKYDTNINKIIYLENKTIVQAVATSKYSNNYFPKETESITVNVPKVEKIEPSYTILVNGSKIQEEKLTYNKEEGTLTFTNNGIDGDSIIWNEEGDTYTIIFVYENVARLDEQVKIQPQFSTKLYNSTKTMSGKPWASSNVKKGTIASVEAKAISKDVYKGYMYANSNETIYSEQYDLELSSADVKTATLELKEDNFKTDNGNTLTTKNLTQYKEIKIDKKSLESVLGSTGILEIIHVGAKASEVTINSSTEADEDGNIVIGMDKLKYAHNVKIQISYAENEGTIKFIATKSINGNAGYDKETIKTINAIETTVQAYTEKDEEPGTATATTELKETQTVATIAMNNDNTLSTKNENEIEFVVTLKTGTIETDLLENPTIKIELPEEVTNINLTSVSALYAEEKLKIASQEVVDNGRAILIKLDGKQENYINKLIEGIKVTVNAKITLNDMAISRDAKIEMKYTNDNSKQSEYTASTDVKIQAPDGFITKTVLNAKFENTKKGEETLKTIIVNNYGTTAENIKLIGTMPNTKFSQEEFETKIKQSISVVCTSKSGEETKITGDNIEIEYSADGKNWTSEKENAAYFRIASKDGNITLKPGEKLTGSVTIDISNVMRDFKLVFTLGSNEQMLNLNIDKLISNLDEVQDPEEQEEEPKQEEPKQEEPKQEEQKEDEPKQEEPKEEEPKQEEPKEDEPKQEEQKEDEPKQEEPKQDEPTKTEVKEDTIAVKMVAKVGNSELKDGEAVGQGQVIKYTYKVTNNTKNELKNIKFEANHENVNIFEYVTYEEEFTLDPDEMKQYTYEEETDKSSTEYEIKSLKAGETKNITYQVRVKKDVSQIKVNAAVSLDTGKTIKVENTNPVKQADLKLELTNNIAKENTLAKGSVFVNIFTIKNTSNEKQTDIVVNFDIPEEFKFSELREGKDANNNYTVIQQSDNFLTFKINELAPGAEKEMLVSLEVVDKTTSIKQKSIVYYANKGAEVYYSNELKVAIVNLPNSKFEATLTDNLGETVKTGDKLIYTITIKNISDISDIAMITDKVPEAAVVKKVYYELGEQKENVENIQNNIVSSMISIEPKQTAKLYIETEINENLTGEEEIVNYANILANHMEEDIKTNETRHILKTNKEANNNKQTPNTPNNQNTGVVKQDEKDDNKTTTPTEQNNSEEQKNENNTTTPKDSNDTKTTETNNAKSTVKIKHSVSGVAWIDSNKNGNREASEKLIKDMKVSLANIETGKYEAHTTTNDKGEYKFENIEDGKYIVVFTYDNARYRNTEYRVKSAQETNNSDIITSKISTSNEDIKFGITDTLELKGKSLENIDAGFIQNEIFDLKIDNYVSKITVQNSAGTTTKQYDNSQLAKIEISDKYIAGSTILVEYTIEVANVGEIPGYANEIVDYLPKDLTFSSEMNKNWYLTTDGNLHTTALAKKLINPGETKTITLILVKKMTENNIGLTSNKAEITKSSNSLSVPDKNLKSGSNTGTAELIISISTGDGLALGIIITILAITTTGIVIYTKKRKEVNHE